MPTDNNGLDMVLFNIHEFHMLQKCDRLAPNVTFTIRLLFMPVTAGTTISVYL